MLSLPPARRGGTGFRAIFAGRRGVERPAAELGSPDRVSPDRQPAVENGPRMRPLKADDRPGEALEGFDAAPGRPSSEVPALRGPGPFSCWPYLCGAGGDFGDGLGGDGGAAGAEGRTFPSGEIRR